MRLGRPYQSGVHPGERWLPSRDMFWCVEGVETDKHVCVKRFRDELNSDVKDGQEERVHSKKINKMIFISKGKTEMHAGVCL